ncbi:MAG: Mrp/NBP35 family ATP-binding protein [Haloquadratum sp.]
MGTGQPAADHATRVSEALAEAGIATDLTFAGLTDLDAIDVSVAGGTATVTVTLPVPAADARASIERDVEAAVERVDEIDRVECRFEPAAPDLAAAVDPIPDVKNVVAVASGKGGVGKSTVAVNLATALASTGASVGLVDADIYGPNAPAMLGLGERTPDANLDDEIQPREAYGVQVMSMDFLVGEDDPVIWRGPMVEKFITQLFADVDWGTLEYLLVDLPPGTGDAHLSVVQQLPVTGAVIVTTPEPVAADDASRGLRGFAEYDVPILGIVENMASFECPDCGSDHDIFDDGGGAQLAAEFNVPVLGELPLDPAVGTLGAAAGDGGDTGGDPPGISIPGLGRLQLPRLRAERERPETAPPIAVRDDGGTLRTAVELLATRTAARISQYAVERADESGSDGDG